MEDRERLLLEKQRLELQIKIAKAKAAKAATATPPGKTMSTLDTARGAAQAVTAGVLSEFGDEVVGGLRTVGDYVTPEAWGEDAQSFGDKYRMYRDDERENLKQFTEDNPGSALALNVAGSVASPLNKIKGLTRAADLSRAERLALAGKTMARGGAEGALSGFGAGEGDVSSQLGNTAKGAGFGAGLSGVGTGMGYGYNALTRRAPGIDDLVDPVTKEFTPVTLADRSENRTWGNLYRDWVGGGFGSANKIAHQEAPHIARAANQLEVADLAERNLRVQETQDLANRRLAEKAAIPAAVVTPKGDPRTAPETVAAYTTIAQHATPARAAKKGYFDDAEAGTRKYAGRLNRYWSKKAFEDVKKGVFTLDDTMRGQLNNLGPADKLELGEVLDEVAARRAKAEGGDTLAYYRGMDPDKRVAALLEGDIDGEVLMAIRNKYAAGANKKPGSMEGGARRIVARELDDVIRRGFAGDADKLKNFEDELERYTAYLTVKNAAGKKSSTAAKLAGGAPTIEELTTKASRYGRVDPDTGVDVIPGGRAFERYAAELAARDAARVQANVASKAQRKAAAAALTARKPDEDAALKLTHIARDTDKATILNRAKEEMQRLAASATRSQVSPLSRRLNTIQLGSMVPVVSDAPLLGKLSSGIALAAGAGTERGQKFVVGQLDWQKKAAENIRKGAWDKRNLAVTRALTQQAVQE